MKLESGIHHIGLFTNRPEVLQEFYAKSLGFAELESKPVPAALMESIFNLSHQGAVTKLALGNVILEVISLEDDEMEGRPEAAVGYNHWCLGVSDLEQWVLQLKSRGVPVIEFRTGEKTIVFLRDPDSNLVELYQT